ncbi:MAG: type II toxin-antitoxin system prevent-host-death family antitoxin [Rubrivivax sp.]|nr:type II toxin-antitoxin system prevent-host-death family antitoxin [Rubrivivax sp.]
MPAVVNIYEAKTHLSRLVEQAAKGREFIIAKDGKPLVRVIPIEPPGAERALGFLKGQGVVEADVKEAFRGEIEAMFSSKR